MTISIDALRSAEELSDCVQLQELLLGDHARSIIHLPALASIQRSGGLLVGAWREEGTTRVLEGALVDLIGTAGAFPSRFTLFHGVASNARNRGIGTALRLGERDHCRHNGVDVVNWWIDPLRSVEAHVALNKLGGIATAYSRNVLGELEDSPNRGLATDRLQVEWWVEAPRVVSILDRGVASRHLATGLHQMDVLTKTAARPGGHRTLQSYETSATNRYVLAEIPTDLDRLRHEDPEAARRWRLGLRELLEVLLSDGFIVVGLIHEAGRSFHLLERVDRSDVLGRP